MKFLINESQLLETVLQQRAILSDKPTYSFRVLIKHYFRQGYDRSGVLLALEQFLREQPNYNFVRWEKHLERLTASIYKENLNKPDVDKYLPTDVKEVKVYVDELAELRKIEDLSAEKLAFAILVTCKVRNALRGTFSSFFVPDRELYRDAALSPEDKKREKKLMYILNNKELVSIPMLVSSRNYNALFLRDSGIEVMTIRDFEHVALYYERWTGQKNIAECNCGRLFVRTSNRSKYCKVCAIERNRELTREKMRNNRILLAARGN